MRDLVIVGAGGFGRETIDLVRAINAKTPTWSLVGVADDSPSQANLDRLAALGIAHVGGTSSIRPGTAVTVSVGSPQARRSVVAALSSRGHEHPALVHPSTVIGSNFQHGVGLVVLGGVSIGTNVTLDDHVHLNAHSVIGHDAELRDFVSVNPNATVSGDCVIGRETLLGAASTVLQQVGVGAGVTVGAAACVTRPLPDGCTAVGVPAQPLQKGESV